MGVANTSTDQRTIPWVYGVVVGVAAYVFSYVLSYAMWAMTEFPDTVSGMMREFITNQVSDWVFAGWLLYNAHFVNIEAEGIVSDSSWDFIEVVSQSSTDILLIVVPGVLLVAAVALARIAGAASAADGAVAGVTVVLGYLPLVVLGVFVFTADDAAPMLMQSVFLAGIVYPVAIGAIGGAVAGELA